ncbi:MAG: hypothetical protein WHS65_11005 [Melioribacteraceae bacterium]
MANDDYTKRLENVIKQMLQPLKNIPFNLVIEALTGKKVLLFDFNDVEHQKVLAKLKDVALLAGKKINQIGILRQRPNEVGNDIEKFVKEAFDEKQLEADRPTSSSGRKKSTGYPDIIFWFNNNPYYLECKTYNIKNISTTQRSFYFSPSNEFKVIYDAPHFLLAYEIYVSDKKGKKNIYKCRSYKVLSLETVSVDVKYEFNSDNKRLYSNINGAKILAEGKIK